MDGSEPVWEDPGHALLASRGGIIRVDVRTGAVERAYGTCIPVAPLLSP